MSIFILVMKIASRSCWGVCGKLKEHKRCNVKVDFCRLLAHTYNTNDLVAHTHCTGPGLGQEQGQGWAQ